jgi:hypothetical protein
MKHNVDECDTRSPQAFVSRQLSITKRLYDVRFAFRIFRAVWDNIEFPQIYRNHKSFNSSDIFNEMIPISIQFVQVEKTHK